MRELFAAHEADRFELHSRHMNNMMVRVLKTIGFDVRFVSGKGAYLGDSSGARYLDLLSGFGVFQIGRNHPRLAEALKSVLDSDLPNLVQMDVSVLAGVLAERLLAYAPWLDKVFFANSGTEAVRGRRQIRARRDRSAGDRSLRAFVPRTDLWLAFRQWRRNFSRRIRPAAARFRRNPVQRSCRARTRACAPRRRGVLLRADPRQGREYARRPTISGARRISAGNTGRCSSPTRSRPGLAEPAASSPSSIGAWSPTWS